VDSFVATGDPLLTSISNLRKEKKERKFIVHVQGVPYIAQGLTLENNWVYFRSFGEAGNDRVCFSSFGGFLWVFIGWGHRRMPLYVTAGAIAPLP
jgi:hypothetical protein